jgi:hypothetical protein|tara:strand:+ start:856 stop:1020 length:165 start_codon:yes stop_codon:yes gene_type:complete
MAEPVDVSKKHFYISMIKSGVRILGCGVCLFTGNVIWLASGFLVAELLGIAEEL